MRDKSAKPGRTSKITEPMDAVEIAELELETVTGGCSQCGRPDATHQPEQQPANSNR